MFRMCFIVFWDQILAYLKPHEGQSLDLQVRGNLWIMGQRGHLNLMKPLDISLQARNLSIDCIMYLRCLSSILFFLYDIFVSHKYIIQKISRISNSAFFIFFFLTLFSLLLIFLYPNFLFSLLLLFFLVQIYHFHLILFPLIHI